MRATMKTGQYSGVFVCFYSFLWLFSLAMPFSAQLGGQLSMKDPPLQAPEATADLLHQLSRRFRCWEQERSAVTS